MKLLTKYMIYSVVIIAVIAASMIIFEDHPEAQFAFIFPGIFLVVFSEIMDDAFRKASIRKGLQKER